LGRAPGTPVEVVLPPLMVLRAKGRTWLAETRRQQRAPGAMKAVVDRGGAEDTRPDQGHQQADDDHHREDHASRRNIEEDLRRI
jgi:hypothetical protein